MPHALIIEDNMIITRAIQSCLEPLGFVTFDHAWTEEQAVVAARQRAPDLVVILNASSVVGIYGNFGQTNYAATKFGVIGFTKTWSRELGPKGVRVNAVTPGGVYSGQNDTFVRNYSRKVPLGRMASEQDMAHAMQYLCSEASRYVTGHNLVVDGGWTAW